MSEQTNIPTVEETNRRLSEPVRPEGYIAPTAFAGESVEDIVEDDSSNAPEEAVTPVFVCDQCDFVAKTASGLKSHARKHAVTLAKEDEVTPAESDFSEQDSK